MRVFFYLQMHIEIYYHDFTLVIISIIFCSYKNTSHIDKNSATHQWEYRES